MSKGQAESEMASILEPLNEKAGKRQIPQYTFRQYVEDVYLPVCRRKWKESTWMTSEPTITFHLLPPFGAKLMKDLKRDTMQAFLDRKARTHLDSIVGHLRWHLSGIFKMAISDGAVDLNPTLGLYIPACKPGKPKRNLNATQIRAALEALDLRERLVFRMAVFDGMRPGEILAIRIRAISELSILVDQRVYRGDIDSLKGRKGKPTKRTVGLSPGTLEDLKAWISQFEGRPDDAFLFPSERLDRPVGRDNLWRRHMRPKLEKIGLEWATFQVLRRTNASLGRKALIDDKVAADQRGHGLGVSLEVYSISDLEQKIEAVRRIESEVIPGKNSDASPQQRLAGNGSPSRKTE